MDTGMGMMAGADTGTTHAGAVLTCCETDCSWNEKKCCRAAAIQVGDEHPRCDTYTRAAVGTHAMADAGVASCMVRDCSFNGGGTCGAPGITLGDHGGHADCLTARMG